MSGWKKSPKFYRGERKKNFVGLCMFIRSFAFLKREKNVKIGGHGRDESMQLKWMYFIPFFFTTKKKKWTPTATGAAIEA